MHLAINPPLVREHEDKLTAAALLVDLLVNVS